MLTLVSLSVYSKKSLYNAEDTISPGFRLFQCIEKNVRTYTLSTPKHSTSTFTCYVINGLLQSLNAFLNSSSFCKRKRTPGEKLQGLIKTDSNKGWHSISTSAERAGSSNKIEVHFKNVCQINFNLVAPIFKFMWFLSKSHLKIHLPPAKERKYTCPSLGISIKIQDVNTLDQ